MGVDRGRPFTVTRYVIALRYASIIVGLDQHLPSIEGVGFFDLLCADCGETYVKVHLFATRNYEQRHNFVLLLGHLHLHSLIPGAVTGDGTHQNAPNILETKNSYYIKQNVTLTTVVLTT